MNLGETKRSGAGNVVLYEGDALFDPVVKGFLQKEGLGMAPATFSGTPFTITYKAIDLLDDPVGGFKEVCPARMQVQNPTNAGSPQVLLDKVRGISGGLADHVRKASHMNIYLVSLQVEVMVGPKDTVLVRPPKAVFLHKLADSKRANDELKMNVADSLAAPTLVHVREKAA